MSVSLNYELTTFLFSVLAGIYCSIIFDFFRAIRLCFSGKNIFVGISDIVFWIICCIICFLSIYNKSSGELRLYQISGIAISSFIYFLTLSKAVKCIFSIFFKILKFIFKIVLTPIVFLYKILLSVFIKHQPNNDTFGGTDETKKSS